MPQKIKKATPGPCAATQREHPSLFDAPSDPEDNYSDEPRHPFVDRMISVECKLDELIRCYRERDMSGFRTTILDNAEFIKLFRITSKTAQNWRDEGLIEYSQVKGKIYYRAEEVEKLLNRTRR